MKLSAPRKRHIAAVLAVGAFTLVTIQPAYALFGIGPEIVFDPTNLEQNIMTAAHTLEMINNQIQQLQNEATALMNDAKNLQALDFNSLNRLLTTLSSTQRLIEQAQGLAFQVAALERDFERLYPAEYAAAITRSQLLEDRHEQWTNSRDAVDTALQVQAQSNENFQADGQVLSDLVTRSQSAVGNLQAVQATNQLLALQSRQLMQGQQLQIADDRAAATEQARLLAAEERSRALRRQFMTTSTAYTPEPVQTF